jgi:hypothetical protein
MHFYAVFEFKYYQYFSYDITAYDISVHNSVEASLRPFPALPISYLLATLIESYWGLDSKMYRANRKLQVA